MTGIFQTSGATREVSDDRMAPTGDRVSDAVDAELRRIGVHLGRLKVEIEEERAVHALERTTLVSDAVERLRHILHDVRWLADLDQVALEAEWVELEQVVTALLDRWHGRLRAADALVIREPLPAVWVSRADVSIVLEELLENAVRYRGSDPLVIRISAERDEDEWIVDMADNGRGFDAQHAEQVFDPLFVLVGDGVPMGSGVGLTAARMLMERNRGSIKALSHAGVGTTVRLRFRTDGGSGERR